MRGVNVNMFYDDLNTEEQVSYLIKPILQVLQEAGGQLERSEIRDRISELDEHIAEFEQKLYTSNKTGNQYKKFDFKFNFAIKELSYVGLISYVKFNPKITLTQDGANVDLTDFDVKTEVRDKARSYWEEHSTKNKSKNKPVETLEVCPLRTASELRYLQSWTRIISAGSPFQEAILCILPISLR